MAKGKALVDLKITAAERKKREERYKKPYPMDGGDVYPYDTRINFNDDMLDKIGITSLPKVGKKVKIVAECVVTSTSENASTMGGSDHKNRSMGLQIQKIALDIDGGDAKDAIDEALEQLKS